MNHWKLLNAYQSTQEDYEHIVETLTKVVDEYKDDPVVASALRHQITVAQANAIATKQSVFEITKHMA